MKFLQFAYQNIKNSILVTLLTFFSFSSAYAGLIPSDISIVDASVTFDVDSFGDTSGDFDLVSAGVATTSDFAGDTVTTGDNPIMGNLTHTGDGVGFSGDVSISDDEYTIGFDSLLSVENLSAVDMYEIVFKLTFRNLVNASGLDSFADSEFTFFANGDEVFFSDLLSDSFYGNEIAGDSVPGFGGELSESDTLYFSFMLDPTEFLDIELSWTLSGGDFDSGNSQASFSQFLAIDSITNQSTPVDDIPEPTSLILFALGILALNQKQIRS